MPCAHVHVRRKGKWDWLALCHFVRTYRYRDRSLDILYRSCNITRFVSSLGIADIGFACYRCRTKCCPHCKSLDHWIFFLFFTKMKLFDSIVTFVYRMFLAWSVRFKSRRNEVILSKKSRHTCFRKAWVSVEICAREEKEERATGGHNNRHFIETTALRPSFV